MSSRALTARVLSVMTLPKTQKAMVFSEYGGDLEYRDIPVPTKKANEILINVKYSGVCHSDLYVWKNRTPMTSKLPLVGGHEGAGVVVGMGSNVKNWKIGDKAGVKWLNSTCMTCEHCELGNEPSCLKSEYNGFTRNGSFQQYVAVDAIHAPRLPDNCDLAELAPASCAGVTVYKAIKSANIRAGQWMAITGACGGLGSVAIQYCKAMGYRVVGIDAGEAKANLFKELGGEVFIDFTKSKDLVADVVSATNGGAHGVLSIAATEDAINTSVKYVRSNGTCVIVSVPDGAYCKSDVFNQVVKSISIVGTYVANRAETREAIDFFARGLVKAPIEIVPLSQLLQVYKKIESGEVIGRYVLDTSM
ncbi:hypothetical protein KAFR_0L02000 [Kazachstania africana CBS 2517]|uniref:alcohol dehydrogenase n=1 Tax=Kazachstania africana (strain ATCC 22294 / BCRC 22015 / CBS 2517 / CECT 1963 / NBRC 1671 / NRRL Y-8276) TaxID=1071382 RepID=H2B2G1_KAZAF|nr:hypothetical protein KAFR_0L02000 [Kazachstania africana CBS 2517]CCF60811.1 hypothetical protein KAFR_0L02000 [Kazachstania africana CBS 2517]